MNVSDKIMLRASCLLNVALLVSIIVILNLAHYGRFLDPESRKVVQAANAVRQIPESPQVLEVKAMVRRLESLGLHPFSVCNNNGKWRIKFINEDNLKSIEWTRDIPLEELGIHGSKVRDITPLEVQSDLQTLDATSSSIADLTPLRHLKKMQKLSLSYTLVSDLQPIAGIDIKELNLAGIPADDISMIRTNELEILRISFDKNKKWKGIGRIRACPNVKINGFVNPKEGWAMYDRIYGGSE